VDTDSSPRLDGFGLRATITPAAIARMRSLLTCSVISCRKCRAHSAQLMRRSSKEHLPADSACFGTAQLISVKTVNPGYKAALSQRKDIDIGKIL